VAEACCDLYGDEWGDNRMTPSDLVHLGYALAYDVDYFITTDSVLNEYRVPEGFKLKVLHPKDAIKRILVPNAFFVSFVIFVVISSKLIVDQKPKASPQRTQRSQRTHKGRSVMGIMTVPPWLCSVRAAGIFNRTTEAQRHRAVSRPFPL